MKISIIVAIDINRVMGQKNALPWPEPIPADWDHLKKVTEGKKMIMGKASYDSKHRVWSKVGNIVLSRKQDLLLDEGFEYAPSLQEALSMVKYEKEVFVIGGAGVFAEVMPQVHTIYLTKVLQAFEGDTFLPDFDLSKYVLEYKQNYLPGKNTPYPIVIEKWVKQDNI